ncbi:hypothetical protein [Paenibacillus sp. OV219]|uniref:hypothetical protein n=1 Tax=Paenibacillus sp. OV219 TaxID=1884377 RepID=UPI0008C0DABE|nr:hypothetical protein [Paenibacillus sp. OV219]SEM50916.1 hypothetical protein SAMN05518847_10124 [Paenibacillus sp. OV219]
MKILFRMMILLVIVTSMTFLFGCSNKSDNQSEDAVVKEEKIVGNEKIELGLSEDIKKLTITQLSQISEDMTYKEVVSTLGNTKDIGSGLYIFRYEYEDGQFLDITFGNYDETIRKENYIAIQKMISDTN